jgi:DNA-binding XRE family transcriptional regulator
MRETKKKSLKEKGWRVGSTADFLGLSDEETKYIEMKLKLAEGLRQRRQRRKLTQAELARRLRSSQSRIAKMEAGDPGVSLDLLVKSLLALGMSERDIARLMSGGRASKSA